MGNIGSHVTLPRGANDIKRKNEASANMALYYRESKPRPIMR
jgi:hypothetical protein